MISLLGHVLPLALGAAVSPALVAVTVDLLATQGRRRRRSVAAYLIGSLLPLVALAVVTLVVAPGVMKTARPGEGRVVDVVDIVLGAGLLALAVVALVRRSPQRAQKPRRAIGVAGLVPLGIGTMLTNVSTLALVIAGLREIALASVAWPAELTVLVLLIVMAVAPIWLPLLADMVAPHATGRALTPLSALMARHGRVIAATVAAVTGAYLLGRGLRWW